MTKYRQVGGRLGAYIRTGSPSTQQIQGLLADLLVGDELLPTMREVVGCATFHALQNLAGSGCGAVQRDVLLNQLSRRYLPVVIEDVNELINGMLDLKQVPFKGSADDGINITENPDQDSQDPWSSSHSVSADVDGPNRVSRDTGSSAPRQLSPSEICDETIWNAQRDPDIDKRFLKAWNLRWFNKRYRPRLERD